MGIPRPYPGSWRIESGSKNFIPGGYGSGSASKFHYKDMGLGLGFYKEGFNKRGKKPPFKKGGQSSSLFKVKCFECNSNDYLVADCPKAIEKEKGALESKLEALKKRRKARA
ncbi:hypothetical protein M9H77_36412 [Catharanthus roseus]|uniref:Uncharacterized protein n=1 Tax=Catharanthus roseus TaxID=4058 RepID=A0ACB9ZRQ4_CATRO|nr:hypothetical protein M9H77_36412 [Catharanthus roseus]